MVARLGGDDPLVAMQRAALAASITVSRAGAMESIPVAAELDRSNLFTEG
ncbi:MAG: hypothetical protein K9L66_12750 [Spirochaetaceae bacterium]|nr:hypothetical protein [Spirochaetaceae bacterium]